ncbi:glutaredoxin-C9-like [Senna tora]|uniref:Glutaredoxin-C9-like n=1 Tax=Senna tora TaxID=362788 RepID=A0A834VYT0_9FABA|nr:glutaredoxin-C9-like [Senna tora]
MEQRLRILGEGERLAGTLLERILARGLRGDHSRKRRPSTGQVVLLDQIQTLVDSIFDQVILLGAYVKRFPDAFRSFGVFLQRFDDIRDLQGLVHRRRDLDDGGFHGLKCFVDVRCDGFYAQIYVLPKQVLNEEKRQRTLFHQYSHISHNHNSSASGRQEGMVAKMVSENAVIVIGRRGCCMSHLVKRLLLGLGVNPAVYEVDEKDEKVCLLDSPTPFDLATTPHVNASSSLPNTSPSLASLSIYGSAPIFPTNHSLLSSISSKEMRSMSFLSYRALRA